jgi:Skp family chaperone for outer membrane proteins
MLLLATHGFARSNNDKIAGFNVERAVSMTDQGRYELEELSKKLELTQRELKAMNIEIEDLKQRLNSRASSMSDADRANLQSEIDAKQKSFDFSSEEAKKSAQAQQNEIKQRIVTKASRRLLPAACLRVE